MATPAADFLDVRRHGFLRVAVCVPEVRLADPAGNAEEHARLLQRAAEAGARYAVFPELGLTGYSCGDLFHQEVLQRGARDALSQLLEATRSLPVAFSVGLPLAVDGALYNVVVTAQQGSALTVVPKSYLPGYREFYEPRWFRPAAECRASEVALPGSAGPVPFGVDCLLRFADLPAAVLAIDVCEDLWVPVAPSTLAALAGATLLANLSASNVTVAKFEYRRQLVAGAAARNLAVQLYGAAGFGESTADLAWDGHGLIADRGEIVAETERLTSGGALALADVDLEAIVQDRIRQGTFSANAAAMRAASPRFRVIDAPAPGRRDAAPFQILRREVPAQPFVPADPARRDERCREVFSIQATSLARRIVALPTDARRLVLGLSGGQDSTHALLVAAHAVDLLGAPRSSILALTMPGFGTTPRTRNNAGRLAQALGVEFRELRIDALAGSVYDAIGHPHEVEDLTFENVQAWLRKLLLFATASQVRGIDLGTGDLSELALGWCTYGGDHMSHYGVNSGVPKTLISYLIRWASEVVFRDEPGVATVLADVLATPISPELKRPSPQGEILQRSEDVVGPYELHDFFLYHFLRFGAGPRRVARLAHHAFAGRYDLATIRRWLRVFLTRFFASQYKRDALPDGPKVGSGGALSPRGDWRMPAEASVVAWLREAETIPEET